MDKRREDKIYTSIQAGPPDIHCYLALAAFMSLLPSFGLTDTTWSMDCCRK